MNELNASSTVSGQSYMNKDVLCLVVPAQEGGLIPLLADRLTLPQSS